MIISRTNITLLVIIMLCFFCNESIAQDDQHRIDNLKHELTTQATYTNLGIIYSLGFNKQTATE